MAPDSYYRFQPDPFRFGEVINKRKVKAIGLQEHVMKAGNVLIDHTSKATGECLRSGCSRLVLPPGECGGGLV